MVVVGILIALQVNNQNIKQQANSVERQYYETMDTQLIEDRALLNVEIYGITQRIGNFALGVKLLIDGDRKRLK